MKQFINQKLTECHDCGDEINSGATAYETKDEDVICENCYRNYLKDTI